MATYLISFEDLTNATPLGGNIDVDRYKFCIEDVQNSKILELLGETLYNKIEADYIAETLEGAYLTLYDKFIKPILIHSAAAEYMIIGGYQVSNGGIYKHTPANGTPVESSDIERLVNNQRTKVEMYVERMQRYILLNYASIPEYAWRYENNVNPNYRSNTLDFDIVSNKMPKIWFTNDSGDLTNN